MIPTYIWDAVKINECQDRTIDLLREIEQNSRYHDKSKADSWRCSFCDNGRQEPHKQDCLYLRIEQLLEEIDDVDKLINGNPNSPSSFDGLSGIIDNGRPQTKIT